MFIGPTWCHLLFYFTSYVLNMFRTLIYPSSGACDSVVELPHRSPCSQFVVCWRFAAAGFGWRSFCRLQPAACNTSTTQTQPHQISNTQWTENKTTDVVILVINQLDAQNFVLQVYFITLHVLSTCAHRQEVKIVLYSLWYHHTCRWPSRAPDGRVMIPDAV